ncbi:hypothetical protein K2X33_03355, partial [bacterium]|nr:hypothetical protein [bacterium]
SAAIGSDVNSRSMDLFAYSNNKTSTDPVKFCYGGINECQADENRWENGIPAQGDQSKTLARVNFKMENGKRTLITVRGQDSTGNACYSAFEVGRVEGDGFLAAIPDRTTTLDNLNTPSLPEPPPPPPYDEARLARINEFRTKYELPVIMGDEKTMAEFEKNARAGMELTNKERAKNGDLPPLTYDFLLSVIAKTNNDILKTSHRPAGVKTHHQFTDNTGQNWANHGTLEAAMHTWMYDDGPHWGHRTNILRNWKKGGFAGEPGNWTGEFSY